MHSSDPGSESPSSLGTISFFAGYRFRDASLLREALTHSSARRQGRWNERLEFLGDAVLGLVVAKCLWQHFAEADEGWMSRVRAKFVCEASLAHLAAQMNIGDHLVLGRTEQLGGGKDKTSILADACEALLGAVYADGGIQAVEDMLKPWLNDMVKGIEDSVEEAIFDPKTKLQEWTQKHLKSLPEYHYESNGGPAHLPEFRVSIRIGERELSSAIGSSKKRAATIAAAEALAALKHVDDLKVQTND